APWLLAAAWTVMEWSRVMQPIPFCWGDLNQSQHRALAVLQVLDLTGPYGLSFLMAATTASLASVALRRPGAWRSMQVAGAAVALVMARGAWLLASHPTPPPGRVVAGPPELRAARLPTGDDPHPQPPPAFEVPA